MKSSFTCHNYVYRNLVKWNVRINVRQNARSRGIPVISLMKWIIFCWASFSDLELHFIFLSWGTSFRWMYCDVTLYWAECTNKGSNCGLDFVVSKKAMWLSPVLRQSNDLLRLSIILHWTSCCTSASRVANWNRNISHKRACFSES